MLQKIVSPGYAEVLELLPKAKAVIAVHAAVIQSTLTDAKATTIRRRYSGGVRTGIPNTSVSSYQRIASHSAECATCLTDGDPTVANPDWYAAQHPDVRQGVASGEIEDIGDH